MMGGQIWVDSVPGKGSTFAFTAMFGRARETGARLASLVGDLRGLRVLVVDDSQSSRDIFSEALKSMTFDVGLAASGEEALAELDRANDVGRPYDFVLMDYKMPGLDGIETTRRIAGRSRTGKAPAVIMVTAYGREEIMRQAESAGIKSFLIKPVNQSVLLNTIMETYGHDRGHAFHPIASQSAAIDAMSAIRGARLLVAEDNEINQQVAREILQSAGLRVDIANTGREAVEKVRTNFYDAVLMDIQMPELDGLQATAELRRDARFTDLPIIAMTAHAMSGDRERSLAAGMNDHVSKPIDPDALYAALLKWIRPGERAPVSVPQPLPRDAMSPGENTPHPLDALPGIDSATGRRRVAGNEALYGKLLLDFHRNYAASVERIVAALSQGTLADAEREVHTLKGVAGNIGAMQLHRAAEELDLALRSGDLGKARSLLPGVERELSLVIDGLDPLAKDAAVARDGAQSSDVMAAGAVDRAALQKAARALSDLVRKNDPEADHALEQLRAALQGGRRKELEGIAQALDVFDFRGAAKALAALAEAEGIMLGAPS
jgi:two-component system sensor histidine kinase/response regulator